MGYSCGYTDTIQLGDANWPLPKNFGDSEKAFDLNG